MWDPSIYPNPEKFDGYRFFNLRESGNKSTSLTTSSVQHIAFGIGKPVCPGRFFAANELKVAIAQIILKYDIRLEKGTSTEVMEMGFEMLADPNAKLEVRRLLD